MLAIDLAAAAFARLQNRIRQAPQPRALEPIVWALLMHRLDEIEALLEGQDHRSEIAAAAILQGWDDLDRAIDRRLKDFEHGAR